VSQSPSAAPGDEASSAAIPYLLGWTAINKLMRRGHSWSGNERNSAFLNLGDGTFADVTHVSGFGLLRDGRALATLDWDLDGDVDLVATNRDAPRAMLFDNLSRDGLPFPSWKSGVVALRLAGTTCNRQAIGARVEVFVAGRERPIVRAVRAGEGYLAQSSTWLHFVVGAGTIERIVVHWPGAAAEEIAGVSEAGAYRVLQGSGSAEAFLPGRDRIETASELVTRAPIGDSGRVVLATSVPLPKLVLRPTEGESIELFGVRPGGTGTGTGRPVLIDLWSATCAPCLKELTSFAARAEDLERADVAFLALSVDEDAEAAASAMERIGWPFAWAFAPPETIDALDALHGTLLDTQERLPLPASFLVDPGGELRAIYLGPLEPDALLRDLRLVDLDAAGQLAASTPFRGRWHSPPRRVLALFRDRFRARGLEEAAREYERGDIQVVQKTRAQLLHEFGRDHARKGDFRAAIDSMRQAVREDPDFFQAQFDLGLLLHRNQEPHEAIGAYLRARELDPKHEDTHFNLALAYLETRQFRSARGELAALEELGSALAKTLAEVIEQVEGGR